MNPTPTKRRRGPLALIGGAVAATAVGVAAGVLADRTQKNRDAALALETGEGFDITPARTQVVVADDGVTLHVEIDEPDPADAAQAAEGTTHDDRVEDLPTVVLTHGYCLSLGSWIYQRRALVKAGYRVVSWDQRGHGQSGPGEPDSYVIDRLGLDLKEVIDATAPTGDLVLVGHSMGGMTIFALAEQFPELIRDRVTGVALIGTSPGGLTLANGGKLATIARGALERLGPLVLGPLSDRPRLWAKMRNFAGPLEDFIVAENSFASPVAASVVRYTSNMLLGTPLDVINDYLQTFDGFDKRPALAHFRRTMVLVFNGVQDIVTPPEHSELIVEGIPGAEHVLVNDAGHVIMLEHPDLLNAHLIKLVDNATRARAEHLVASDAPRVRQLVTDLSKARKVREARKGKRSKAAKTAAKATKATGAAGKTRVTNDQRSATGKKAAGRGA